LNVYEPLHRYLGLCMKQSSGQLQIKCWVLVKNSPLLITPFNICKPFEIVFMLYMWQNLKTILCFDIKTISLVTLFETDSSFPFMTPFETMVVLKSALQVLTVSLFSLFETKQQCSPYDSFWNNSSASLMTPCRVPFKCFWGCWGCKEWSNDRVM